MPKWKCCFKLDTNLSLVLSVVGCALLLIRQVVTSSSRRKESRDPPSPGSTSKAPCRQSSVAADICTRLHHTAMIQMIKFSLTYVKGKEKDNFYLKKLNKNWDIIAVILITNKTSAKIKMQLWHGMPNSTNQSVQKLL